MTVQLKQLTETRKGGMHVSLNLHGLPEREEAYFQFSGVWLGKSHQIDVTADRYRVLSWPDNGGQPKERLTDWRITISHSQRTLTDAARRAVREQIEPIVTAWLDSNDYYRARRRAYFKAIRREIAEERYDTRRANRAYNANYAELAPEDATRLVQSIDLLEQFLASLKDDAEVPA